MKMKLQIMLMPYGQSRMVGCNMITILHALRAIGNHVYATLLSFFMPAKEEQYATILHTLRAIGNHLYAMLLSFFIPAKESQALRAKMVVENGLPRCGYSMVKHVQHRN